jgi:hypothetical protein
MAEPRLSIRHKSTPPEEPMSPITERDLEVESRLTALETVVSEIKLVVAQARPQIALLSLLGSGAGAVIVAVVVWYLTKRQ